MACRPIRNTEGKVIGIACSRGRASARCEEPQCSREATLRCDWPVRRARRLGTCDRWCCPAHAVHVGADRDYCLAHARSIGRTSPPAAKVERAMHGHKRLWVEDDATRQDPSAEHLRAAWRRLFGEDYDPKKKRGKTEDLGDTFYVLMPGGRVAVHTCDGDEIWIRQYLKTEETTMETGDARAAAAAAEVARAERQETELAAVAAQWAACTSCGLARTRTSVVPGAFAYVCAGVELERRARPVNLMAIGEGPGATEDERGLPFCGDAGRFMWSAIAERGLLDVVRLDRTFVANLVACRPPNNRAPEADEVRACADRLLLQVAAIRPRAVLLLGASAAAVVLGAERLKAVRGSVMAWRPFADIEGVPQKLAGLVVPTLATWHPSHLLRSGAAADAKLGTDQALDEFLRDVEIAGRLAESVLFATEVPGTQRMELSDVPF